MKTVTKLPGTARLVLKSLAFALSFCLAGQSSVHGQTAVPCPPNIDFSFGNFANWTCYTMSGITDGPCSTCTVAFPSVVLGPGPTPGRHDLTTGTGVDPFGFFPVTAPGGGLFSVKVGNDYNGGEAERIRYTIHVPVGFNNYSFDYKYAVVLENPPHNFNQQPAFTVKGYDSATGLDILCASNTYVADASLLGLGFQTSTVLDRYGLYPYFLPWKTGNLNLSGYGGRTIYVQVTSNDCSPTGHFGYGYFDVVSCGQFAATITYCDLKRGILTLTGPPGYQNYKWFNQTFTTVLNSPPYTSQTINVPAPSTPQYYNLVLTPYNFNGCYDTIKTPVLANFTIDATPDSACNTLGKPIQLNVTTTGGLTTSAFHYNWNHDTTLSSYVIPNPVARPYASGYYVVTVSDTNNCFRQDTVKIENPTFHVDLGLDRVTCLGTPITNLNPRLTPASGPGYVFTWLPGTGISNTTILNPTFTPSTVGNKDYILRVDSGICATSDTINIRTLPNSFAVTNRALCQGDTIVAKSVDGDPIFQYNWSPHNPRFHGWVGPNEDGQSPHVVADTTRIFTITASYHDGINSCPNIVEYLTMRVEPIPHVSIGADTFFKCLYQPVFITAHTNPTTWGVDYAYQWRANDYIDKTNSQIITYIGDKDTDLYLRVRTPLGCTGRDTTHIHVYPGGFGRVTPTEAGLCPRSSVTLTAGGGVKYRWSPDLYLNNANTNVVRSTPVTTTDYNLYVTDIHGCIDTLHSLVTVHPEAVVNLPDSAILFPGESYHLSPQGNLLYYNWFPTVGLSPNATVSNPTATPEVNTRYFLTGTTEEGCTATDSIYILVRDESVIAMPNAFSPGSAPNAMFSVAHAGIANLRSFRIFNRWGTKVFETSNINTGWDGTFNGVPQPVGVYIYTVEGTDSKNKPFAKQGNVTLIR